jgi:hypothetical protein
MPNKWIAALPILAATLWAGLAQAAPVPVRIDDNNSFPESLGSANGTLYIGSSTKAIVYRAKPGAQYAEPWIAAPSGYTRVLGVLADAPTGTLWVCYDNKTTAMLKSFDLKSGAAKNSYPFPGGGLCNDISLKNGDVFTTDTTNGRILKLAKGASALSVWYSNAADPSFDGLVWAKDGKLYVNTFYTSHLIRIDTNPDGTAGKATILNTSIPIYQPDGMRLSSSGKFLLIEGQGHLDNPNFKLGRVDEVTIHGDDATIKVIKDGFEQPTAVTPVGNMIYVLECKSDYNSRPELAGKDPGAFYAYPVPFK